MENSNLISLLKTFSKKEMKEFDKFLRSPYFTEGKGIRHRILYEYFVVLLDFYPGFSGKQFRKEIIFGKIYPEKKFDDRIVRKLNSDLTALAEQYLIQLELEQGDFTVKRNLLIQLNKRKTEKLYLKRFKEMIKFLEGSYRGEEYYYEIYNTWKFYYNYFFPQMNIYKLDKPIGNINNYFIYVLMTSLSIYLWALSFFRSTAIRHNLTMLDEILLHVKNNYKNYKTIPQIHIYYNLILLTLNKNERSFELLKTLKEDSYDKLSLHDRNNMFTMMTNFCHDMILSGSMKYRNERFKLDREYLKKKLYSELGLHISYYLAIAKNALKLGKEKWVREFCKKYTEMLAPVNREFALNYINAEICFKQGRFGKALESLSRLKIEQSNQKQYTRNLMLQIYYEAGDFEAVRSVIDTSKHFLHNDKNLSETGKINSMNFIKLAGELLHAKEKMDFGLIRILRSKILSPLSSQNKDWLLEKIEELLK